MSNQSTGSDHASNPTGAAVQNPHEIPSPAAAACRPSHYTFQVRISDQAFRKLQELSVGNGYLNTASEILENTLCPKGGA